MRLSVTSMFLLGWACVHLGAAFADQEGVLYSKAGGDVTMKPAPTSNPITNILWRHGQNLAAEWTIADDSIEAYGRFAGRVRIDVTTGALTISRLTPEDKGVYAAEVNNQLQTQKTTLFIIYPVPKPTVEKVCDTGGAGCFLICQGNTTGAEPVTYRWKSGGTEKMKDVTKDDSVDIKDFICELKNPISQETSDPVFNPFYREVPGGGGDPKDDREPVEGVKISTGVTVFISLLTAVLVLVFVHRWKAGAWFFQKESLPCQADFWRKQPRETAEVNGTTSPLESGHSDEESPMNKQP